MKEVAGLHQRTKCPFAIGSLVMARKDGAVRSQSIGLPSLVLDTKEPTYDWSGHIGTNSFGMRIDMRVLVYDGADDRVVPLWVDSADYEQYVAGGEA